MADLNREIDTYTRGLLDGYDCVRRALIINKDIPFLSVEDIIEGIDSATKNLKKKYGIVDDSNEEPNNG